MTHFASLPAAALLLGMSAAQALAAPAPVMPTSYDMQNGSTCCFDYRDGAYAGGTGDPSVAYAALSGGSGELTDGVIATDNWHATPEPYVGWRFDELPDPTVTFHFASAVRLSAVTLHYDDSNGPYVFPPLSFSFGATGGPSLTQVVIDDLASAAPTSTTLSLGAGMVGDSFVLEIDNTRGHDTWVMISEVAFTADVPLPAGAPLLIGALGAFGLLARLRRG